MKVAGKPGAWRELVPAASGSEKGHLSSHLSPAHVNPFASAVAKMKSGPERICLGELSQRAVRPPNNPT